MSPAKRILLSAVVVFALQASASAQDLVSVKPPAYPLAARAAGIDGPVKLTGTVSKEGRMQNVRVLSGPPELTQAAVDAVLGWVYKPQRHFGRLVEVETTVTVNFNMGKGQEKAAAQAKAQTELATASQSNSPQNASPQL